MDLPPPYQLQSAFSPNQYTPRPGPISSSAVSRLPLIPRPPGPGGYGGTMSPFGSFGGDPYSTRVTVKTKALNVEFRASTLDAHLGYLSPMSGSIVTTRFFKQGSDGGFTVDLQQHGFVKDRMAQECLDKVLQYVKGLEGGPSGSNGSSSVLIDWLERMLHDAPLLPPGDSKTLTNYFERLADLLSPSVLNGGKRLFDQLQTFFVKNFGSLASFLLADAIADLVCALDGMKRDMRNVIDCLTSGDINVNGHIVEALRRQGGGSRGGLRSETLRALQAAWEAQNTNNGRQIAEALRGPGFNQSVVRSMPGIPPAMQNPQQYTADNIRRLLYPGAGAGVHGRQHYRRRSRRDDDSDEDDDDWPKDRQGWNPFNPYWGAYRGFR